MDRNLSKLWEMVKDREAWRAAVRGVTMNHTWLSDWTTNTNNEISEGGTTVPLFMGENTKEQLP